MIIGICGKSGCGKSTLARKLIEQYPNAIHLDIDKVGHKALTDNISKERLVNRYGISLLTDGNIDRKKLGTIVFNSKEEMDFLTEVTWEYMQKEIDKFLEENKDKIIILDWLLLPKSKYFDMCDIRILLDIPYEIRKQRAMKRDNITEEAFDLREKSSLEYDKDTIRLPRQDLTQERHTKLCNAIPPFATGLPHLYYSHTTFQNNHILPPT